VRSTSQISERDAPFQLRGNNFTVMVLKLVAPDDPSFFPQLLSKIRQAPNFFKNAPVVLDLEELDESAGPADFIDFVVVPGLGFSEKGYRIGRGMGFYDRFLAQPEFIGTSCGLAFDDQIVPELPVLDHDIPLSMLVTDRGIRRFANNCIEK